MKRKILCFCMLLVGFLVSPVQAAEPIRLVNLPFVWANTWTEPSEATQRLLERKVEQAVHVPLNGVTHTLAEIPDKEVDNAYEEAAAETADIRKTGARRSEMVRLVAKKLQADFVVLPMLTGYEEYTFMSLGWHHATLLHAYTSIELYVYDRKEDKVLRKTATRSYQDEYSGQGRASVLVQECMDTVLQETSLHDRLWKEIKSRRAE